jgi:hypothetical protein
MLSQWSNSLKRLDLHSCGISANDILDTIGETFAMLHFAACVNGDDVEFILGGFTPSDGSKDVSIWIVDFDRCCSVNRSDVSALSHI